MVVVAAEGGGGGGDGERGERGGVKRSRRYLGRAEAEWAAEGMSQIWPKRARGDKKPKSDETSSRRAWVFAPSPRFGS